MNRSQDIYSGKRQAYDTFPDTTPRRISGDDSLEASSPTDSRSDEKVIKQNDSKTANAPFETAANKGEVNGNDDEINDDGS
ncbi:MAG: hypothetical protein ACTHOF_15885 [Flavisolibacter sp.]|jgi:hypothetical protein